MPPRTYVVLVIAILLFGAPHLRAEPTRYVVDIPMRAPEPGSYIGMLLSMCLEASKKKDEIIELRFASSLLSQERRIADVQSGASNSLIWVVTDKARETLLRPIRFSFFNGLYGYRLIAIRKQDRAKFAQLNSLSDLTQFVAGQGTHWPDSDILKANGLPLRTGLEREQLYKMLAAGRFDYFPRSITEIWREEEIMKSLDIIIEPHLMLYYPTALYFFVNKDNNELAERIERGLKELERNGELEQLMVSQRDTQIALKEFRLNTRRIILLQNPELPTGTPEFPPDYWITKTKLH